ncbi:MAG: hypothetical protein Q8R20_02985 [Nanoarchaeota archaeon]|nr:hypothetical protein [Nanoarchaeota archaeon]
MTITKPGNKMRHMKFFLVLTLLVSLGGGAYIFEYNTLAAKRDEIRKMKEEIVKAKLSEADLKHVVFEKTDLKKLEETAVRHALIVETRPKYIYVGASGKKSVVLAD